MGDKSLYVICWQILYKKIKFCLLKRLKRYFRHKERINIIFITLILMKIMQLTILLSKKSVKFKGEKEKIN